MENANMDFVNLLNNLDEMGGVFTHVTFFTLGSGVLESGSGRKVFFFSSLDDFCHKANAILELPYDKRGITAEENRIP